MRGYLARSLVFFIIVFHSFYCKGQESYELMPGQSVEIPFKASYPFLDIDYKGNIQFSASIDTGFLSLFIEQINYHKKPVYRGFHLDKPAKPLINEIKFAYSYMGKIFDTVFKHIKPGIEPIFSQQLPDSVKKGHVSCTILKPSLSFAPLENFIQRTNLYYKSDSIFEDAYKKLKTIDYNQVKLLPIYDYTLDEVEATMAFLENNNFEALLHWQEKDPQDFLSKMQKLKIEAGKRRVVLNQKLANLDFEFYNRAKEYLSENDTGKAKELFKKSIETNYFFTLSHLMLAKILLQDKEFMQASEKVHEAYTKTYPMQNDIKLLHDFALQAKNAFFKAADTLYHNNKYNQTLKRLSTAEEFCNNLQVDCSAEIMRMRSKAKFGIYRSYLSVANKSIVSGHPVFAEEYIAKAKSYQDKNKEFIENAHEADELLLSMSKVFEKKGLELLKNKEFNEAVLHFNKASYFCKQYPANECSDSISLLIRTAKMGLLNGFLDKATEYIREENHELAEESIEKAREFQQMHQKELNKVPGIDSLEGKLNFVHYKYLIKEGRFFLKKDEYKIALENMEAAKALEDRYVFKSDTLLFSYMQKAAKFVILDILSDASLKAWAKEDSLAARLLKKGIALQNKYALLNDKAINKKIGKVRKRLRK